MKKYYNIFLLFFFALFANGLMPANNKERWIVVTTIQYPTPALKKLSELEGWQLLVIGDKKTPADWSLPGSCIYLSPEDQDNLPYELCKKLPWNHYSRKNIGYLYAIDHGASIIYETDDDNFIYSEIKCFNDNKSINLLKNPFYIYSGGLPVVNVYDYFGQPGAWPRGYPLGEISKSNCYSVSKVKTPKIVIEQGLVDKEPDLDAIFRLTRLNASDIYFDKTKKACVLEKGFLCPFNSQNTIFHKEAFFGLYIPTFVPFRACDIWRGYVTQRLLWENDYYVCFAPSSAFQDRNQHNLMHDFKDEIDLYLKTSLVVQLLLNWKALSNNILENMISIYDILIDSKVVGSQEKILLNAWNNDLRKILIKKV